MDQTSSYSMTPNSWAGRAFLWIPVTLVFGVGTGGAMTPEHLERARERDSGLSQHRKYSVADSGPTAAEVISAANDIKFIRSVLKTSTLELAKCIGVSRQALYNWRAGSNIKDKNADRVTRLKSAAIVLATEGIEINPTAVRRPITDGKNLLQLIAEGEDGETSARALVTILREETEQQRLLENRFAGRRSARPTIDSHTFREDG